MKRLYLLRHATPEPQVTSDFLRKLTEYGEKQACDFAEFWQKKGYELDAVFCSAADRARSTIAPLLDALPESTHVDISRKYYNISEEEIIEFIKESEDDYFNVLYVGHNPGVTMAAAYFADELPSKLVNGFSPCNMCALEFDVDSWKNIGKYKGNVIDYFIENDE